MTLWRLLLVLFPFYQFSFSHFLFHLHRRFPLLLDLLNLQHVKILIWVYSFLLPTMSDSNIVLFLSPIELVQAPAPSRSRGSDLDREKSYDYTYETCETEDSCDSSNRSGCSGSKILREVALAQYGWIVTRNSLRSLVRPSPKKI